MRKSLPRLLHILAIISLTLAAMPAGAARAQDAQPPLPVYIVQPGDSLTLIAVKFNVNQEELQRVNGMGDANTLMEGQELKIPGLEGVSGTLSTRQVEFGETLASLSRRYQTPAEMLTRLNHITSPAELFVGANLIIPMEEQEPALAGISLGQGQSLLELAVLQNANPWALRRENRISSVVEVLPGDQLYRPAAEGEAESPAPTFHPAIAAIALEPLPLVQGRTTVFSVFTRQPVQLTGKLGERQLTFVEAAPNHYVALQGVHAMAKPGLQMVTLEGQLADGTRFGFSQNVALEPGYYVQDMPLTVDPKTMDPAITQPEDALWKEVTTPVTPQRYWQGPLQLPNRLYRQEWCVESGECWVSRFGSRRSYNGSDYIYYHTGLDIYGGVGVDIYAAAAGTVVFTGELQVRGNATVIDHGWGVYTTYMHQSEILVEEGETVEAGQLIGKVGATGRVEGPHLHWEVIVGSVPVDPLEWLVTDFSPAQAATPQAQ